MRKAADFSKDALQSAFPHSHEHAGHEHHHVHDHGTECGHNGSEHSHDAHDRSKAYAHGEGLFNSLNELRTQAASTSEAASVGIQMSVANIVLAGSVAGALPGAIVTTVLAGGAHIISDAMSQPEGHRLKIGLTSAKSYLGAAALPLYALACAGALGLGAPVAIGAIMATAALPVLRFAPAFAKREAATKGERLSRRKSRKTVAIHLTGLAATVGLAFSQSHVLAAVATTSLFSAPALAAFGGIYGLVKLSRWRRSRKNATAPTLARMGSSRYAKRLKRAATLSDLAQWCTRRRNRLRRLMGQNELLRIHPTTRQALTATPGYKAVADPRQTLRHRIRRGAERLYAISDNTLYGWAKRHTRHLEGHPHAARFQVA